MFVVGKVFGRFLRERGGNVAIIFSLMIIPIVGITGGAVDYARALSARTQIQNATDGAAMAAALAANLTQSERIAIAQSAFAVNVGNISGAPAPTPTVQFGASSITVDAAANIETTFMRIMNINTIPVSAKSTVSTSGKKLEMAVMLDTTGSMDDPAVGGTGTKMDALKSAMTIMLDTVMPVGATNTRMAIVPFSYYVKVPALNPSNYTGRTNYPNHRCALERKKGPRPSEAPPVLGTNEFWIHGNNSSSWCSPIHTIIPLTDDRTVLDPLFTPSSTLLQPAGATAGHLGTQWAWHAISPLWASRWPAESTPVSYTEDDTMKVVVLMTDGANTEFHRYQSGSSANCNGSNPCTQSDDEMKANCDSMKAVQNSQGGEAILIFAVGFGLPAAGTTAGDNARAVLQHCASDDPNNPGQKLYYYPVTQADIEAAFNEIGQAVSVAVNKPRMIN